MPKMILVLILSMLCALTVGCAVKGPLYFPATDAINQPNK